MSNPPCSPGNLLLRAGRKQNTKKAKVEKQNDGSKQNGDEKKKIRIGQLI